MKSIANILTMTTLAIAIGGTSMILTTTPVEADSKKAKSAKSVSGPKKPQGTKSVSGSKKSKGPKSVGSPKISKGTKGVSSTDLGSGR